MADTAIAITAGTGTNVDTRTEATNGNHRQVVVLGDPSINAGVAPVDATKGLAVDLSATGANTNKLLVTPDLPSGAATSAKQDTGNTSLVSIDGKITAVNTGAVVVSSSALPTGAATSAKQDTGNTSVGNVDTNLGAIADASVAAGATGSVHAKLRRISTDINTIATNLPAQGQALAAASTPVVLTAAQITTLTPPAAITGFATAAKQPALGTAGTASADVLTVQGKASMTPLLTDGSATTQPISASSLPLPTLAATSTKQSDGTQKTQVVDGSGNVIGATSNALDVNIKSGSSSGIQYTEDAATAADPVGNMLISRRKDTLSTSEVSADGDNIALNATNKGQLHVKLADTVTVDGSGVTQPVSGTVTANQGGTWTVQPGNTANTTAWKVDGSAVTQPVSLASVPSHAVTNAGTFAVQATEADGANTTLGSKADAKSTATDTTAITVMSVLKQISASVQAPASTPVTGTFWQATQPVSVATIPSHAVTNAGTFAVQAVDAGDVAHDGADSGNPVKVGGKATNVEPAAVSATGDRTNFITDMVGKLITLPYANPENFVSGAITSAMTGTTSTSLVAAPAAGLRNYITTIIVSNAHATVGTDIIIQDGSGGTTLLTIPAAAVYGGAVITLPTPLRQPTTATALYCANVTTGASTKVSAVGYKGV